MFKDSGLRFKFQGLDLKVQEWDSEFGFRI